MEGGGIYNGYLITSMEKAHLKPSKLCFSDSRTYLEDFSPPPLGTHFAPFMPLPKYKKFWCCHRYHDLQNLLDMMSHENPLLDAVDCCNF